MTDLIRPAGIIILPPRSPIGSSRIPAALHTLWGRSMLGHAITAATALKPGRLIIVHGTCPGEAAEAARWTTGQQLVSLTRIGERHGTARAVHDILSTIGVISGTVLITRADMPLLSAGTLSNLAGVHAREGNAVTTLRGSGLSPAGPPASEAGCYAVDSGLLTEALERIRPLIRAELEDTAGLLITSGQHSGSTAAADPADTITAASRTGLEAARAAMRARILCALADGGADIIDPSATWADADVTIGTDATIKPGTHLEGTTMVGAEAVIGPDCTLTDTIVAERARIRNSIATCAVIGPDVSVGPYAHLREGTVVGKGACLGTHVETKDLYAGPGVKALHQSTLLTGTIRDGANIGAGTIFANYDQGVKHHTDVGAGAFIGSGTVLMAPVTIGPEAYTAAGSAIGQDVPGGALGIARGRQHISEGWVRRRSGTTAGTRQRIR